MRKNVSAFIITFWYNPKPKAVNKANWKSIPESMNNQVDHANTHQRHYLFMFVQGQTSYEIVPIGNHTFKLKAPEGFTVKFEVNDKMK